MWVQLQSSGLEERVRLGLVLPSSGSSKFRIFGFDPTIDVVGYPKTETQGGGEKPDFVIPEPQPDLNFGYFCTENSGEKPDFFDT